MSTLATSSMVQPGDILAEKYRVAQVLGAGGMGVVVAAEHIELRERVAIKFLLDGAAGDLELAERFLREARAVVKIKSEHVVRVIDVGRLPSGSPYMVMEYLEGEDLSKRLERGPLPIEDAVDYIIQSCEAMNVAHRAGIVHRDLKPANLFLTQRPDGSPIIKVLDFGISKLTSPAPEQLNLTHTQAMMGSPLYMSPEQMRSSKDVDRRTDIWSLGVILYELLAGDVPFSGSTFPEVLIQVMSEAPPNLRAVRPEVPEGLAAVVLHCLAKLPANRPSSVAALGVALAPFASRRTLNLQSRLESSMSGPAPAPTDLPPLLATRIDAGGPVAALLPVPTAAAPVALGTLRSVDVQGTAIPNATNTSWEGQPPAAAPRAQRQRWGLGLAALGLLTAGALVAGVLGRAGAPEPPPATASAPVDHAPTLAPASLPALVALPSPPDAAAPAPVDVARAPAASVAIAAPEPVVAAKARQPQRASVPAAGARAAKKQAGAAAAPDARATGGRRAAAASEKPGTAPAPERPIKKPKPLSIEFK